MIYGNNSPGAALAMERHRTGNYGEDDYTDETYCYSCGTVIGKLYRIYNGHILCKECLKDYLFDEYKGEYEEVE